MGDAPARSGLAWIALAAIAASGCVVARRAAPAPPAAASPPAAAPAPGPDLFRHAIGGGVTGILGPHRELRGSATYDLQIDRHVRGGHGRAAYGIHAHLSLRNWRLIGAFYEEVAGCRCREMVYGFLFGWLAGTGLLGVGPHVTIGAAGTEKPWLGLGSSVLLSIHPGDDPNPILAHGLWLAAGWDLGQVGLSLRVQYAPEAGVLVGSTGAPVLGASLSLDLLRPRARGR